MKSQETIKRLKEALALPIDDILREEELEQLKSDCIIQLSDFELIPDYILFVEASAETKAKYPNYPYGGHIETVTTEEYTIGRMFSEAFGYVWVVKLPNNLIIRFQEDWNDDGDIQYFSPRLINLTYSDAELDYKDAHLYFTNEQEFYNIN